MQNKSASKIVSEITSIGNGNMNEGFAKLFICYRNMPRVLQTNTNLKIGLGGLTVALVYSLYHNFKNKRKIDELEDEAIRKEISGMTEDEINQIINETLEDIEKTEREENE